MATRATPADVRAIITTSMGDPTIQLWIDSANAIINSRLECINQSEDVLTLIETNLSAHFVALNPDSGGGASVKSEKTKNLETVFNVSQVAESINTTIYGSTANAMSNGCLANYDKPKSQVWFF